jgi:ketosteroid isomerase-like protein
LRLARRLVTGSSGNVELVRAVYDLIRGYLRGEREPMLRSLPELVHPDAAVSPSSALPSGSIGPYYGPRGILQFWDAVLENWSSFDLVPDELVDAPPDLVVAVCRVMAKRKGGRGFAGQVAHVWRVKDGKVAGAHSFQSPDRAFAHAGLTREPRRPEQP